MPGESTMSTSTWVDCDASVSWRKKQPIETARRGPLARQADAVGGPAKKSLRPARRRELPQWFHGTFQVSCARACRLAQWASLVVSTRPRERSVGASARKRRGSSSRSHTSADINLTRSVLKSIHSHTRKLPRNKTFTQADIIG